MAMTVQQLFDLLRDVGDKSQELRFMHMPSGATLTVSSVGQVTDVSNGVSTGSKHMRVELMG